MANKTEHTEHAHCMDCQSCMDLPISLMIDVELDRRADNATVDIGYLCDNCLT